MTIQETRAKVISSIWQAIAQSGVDLSSIPADQQAKLVEAIANNTLVSINEQLQAESASVPEAEAVSDTEERILWEGRPFLSMVESYRITSERIRVHRGMVGRNIENYELVRIQDIDFTQGVTERIFNIGDILISGQDPKTPQLVLRNIPKPEEVYEILRKAWLEARKRHGLQFREYM